MRKTRAAAVWPVLAIAAASLCPFAAAPGVVLHNDASPAPAGQRPDDAVVGLWRNTASCVAIGPDLVITTRHQGGSRGSPVTIGGQDCIVSQIYAHSSADLRIARLTVDGEPAELEYVDIYSDDDERYKVFAVGGYGVGRGDALQTEEVTYGYLWDWEGGQELRWGKNRVDTTSSSSGEFFSYTLKADFDGIGEGGAVAYEAGMASFDSGGGWFILDGGAWKLAGVNRAVEHFGETWFRGDVDPAVPDPDTQDAVRISKYADWIDVVRAGPPCGDANADNCVDYIDLGILAMYYCQTSGVSWSEGDFNEDGVVDYLDLGLMSCNYDLLGGAGDGGTGDLATVPEPASAAILVLGGAAILRRRRGRTR